jgi:hypothetical protein
MTREAIDDQRAVAGGVNPPVDLNSLDISYDTENSILILSDPLLLLPVPFISATSHNDRYM